MRMDRLLADLEAADTARLQAERRAERAECVRAERATVTIADRLRAAIGTDRAVTVVVHGHQCRGRVLEVGAGWAAIDRGLGAPVLDVTDLVRPGVQLVALEGVETVTGLSSRIAGDDAPAVGRGWGAVLRAAARARTAAAWRTRSGSTFAGTIEAVGADHVVVRRPGDLGVVVAYSGISVVEPAAGRPDARR